MTGDIRMPSVTANGHNNRKSYFIDATLAYVALVSCAALIMALDVEARTLLSELATSASIETKILDISRLFLFLFIVGWLFAFVLALAPFAVAMIISIRFRITGKLYFVAMGTITGFLISIILALLANEVSEFHIENSLWSTFTYCWPTLIICGSITGFFCWYILHRFDFWADRTAVQPIPHVP